MMNFFFSFYFLSNLYYGQPNILTMGKAHNGAYISGNLKTLSDSNQIRLTIFDDVFINQTTKGPTIKKSSTEFTGKITNNNFSFALNTLNNARYAVISYNGYPFSSFYIDFKFIIEPGDSVRVAEKEGTLYFTGKNSPKYNCQYQLERLKRKLHEPAGEKDSASINAFFRVADSLAKESFILLENFKQEITPKIYSHEKGAIVSFFESSKVRYLLDNKVYQLSENMLDDGKEQLNYITNYKNPIWNQEIKNKLLSDDYISNSELFLSFLYDQYRYDSCVAINRIFTISNYYNSICSYFSGYKREWLIYSLLSDARLRRSGATDIYSVTQLAVQSGYIKNESIRKFLLYQLTNRPGSQAYDFSLIDIDGKKVKQSDFIGKLTLLDFWYIGCGACIQTKPYLDSIANLFGKADFQIISICVEGRNNRDYSDDWKKAVWSGKYTSPENINLYVQNYQKNSSGIIEKYNIRAYPTIILIDKHGKLTEQPVDPRIDKGRSLVKLIKQYNPEE